MSSETPPDDVPGYVAKRIRTPPPSVCRVLPGSTPVVAFGDPRHSTVATLGLNPSKREFVMNDRELDGSRRRFETLQSLGLECLDNAPDEAVARVWRRCSGYFHGNPYFWFKQLEEMLASVSSSYFGDTACHLDLSHWATDPIWNELTPEERKRLVADDEEFLRVQLRAEPIRQLLLNGRAVVNAFQSVLGGRLEQQPPAVADGTATTRLYSGSYEGIPAIGWSTNLQSSRGVTKLLRQKLAARVAQPEPVLRRDGSRLRRSSGHSLMAFVGPRLRSQARSLEQSSQYSGGSGVHAGSAAEVSPSQMECAWPRKHALPELESEGDLGRSNSMALSLSAVVYDGFAVPRLLIYSGQVVSSRPSRNASDR
jgi:hypothetical protein